MMPQRPPASDGGAAQLGEDGVGVDVATAGERKAPAVAKEHAGGVSSS